MRDFKAGDRVKLIASYINSGSPHKVQKGEGRVIKNDGTEKLSIYVRWPDTNEKYWYNPMHLELVTPEEKVTPTLQPGDRVRIVDNYERRSMEPFGIATGPGTVTENDGTIDRPICVHWDNKGVNNHWYFAESLQRVKDELAPTEQSFEVGQKVAFPKTKSRGIYKIESELVQGMISTARQMGHNYLYIVKIEDGEYFLDEGQNGKGLAFGLEDLIPYTENLDEKKLLDHKQKKEEIKPKEYQAGEYVVITDFGDYEGAGFHFSLGSVYKLTNPFIEGGEMDFDVNKDDEGDPNGIRAHHTTTLKLRPATPEEIEKYESQLFVFPFGEKTVKVSLTGEGNVRLSVSGGYTGEFPLEKLLSLRTVRELSIGGKEISLEPPTFGCQTANSWDEVDAILDYAEKLVEENKTTQE